MEATNSTPTVLLAAGSALILYALGSILVATFSSEARFWRQQEFVGQQKRWFAGFWARVHSLKGTRAMVHDGYSRLSKEGRPISLPQFNDKPLLLLPPSKIKDLIAKPDDEINLIVVLREALATKYTGDDDLGEDPFHLDVVRHQLTRKLPLMTKAVHDELVLGFEDQWKLNGDAWTTVSTMDTCMNIISRAANRVFSGEQLCRNQDFLDHVREYGNGVFTSAAIINILPRWLRPILGPILTYRNGSHVRTCQQIANPIIEERIEQLRAGAKGQQGNTDALQWVIEEAYKRNDPTELNPGKICRRLIRLNMVAIHTTNITITNTLLDLYSSPRTAEFVQGLREEVSRVLAANGGKWTKAVVNDLVRIDSTIKESTRCSSLIIVGLTRMVTNPDGIDLGDGIHVPSGVRVSAPVAGIHRDPRNYDNPDEYDAFRFSRSREVLGENGQILDQRAQGMVTTSDAFLAFGHGKHACPGRFFASQEMKLMLAHIVTNYDVKIEGARPRNSDVKGTCVPDPNAKIMVRRRQ